MSQRQVRNILRVIHLVAAFLIGMYVYSPLGAEPAFTMAARIVLVPLLLITGLWMWQQARVRKWLGGRADTAV